MISLPQEYKLASAVMATATSQILGGVIPLIYFCRKNRSILQLGKTKFEGNVLLRACINDSSEFMRNIAMSNEYRRDQYGSRTGKKIPSTFEAGQTWEADRILHRYRGVHQLYPVTYERRKGSFLTEAAQHI